MQRWSNFQKSTIVPAFRELRARNIFATVQRLACCQSCAHGDLSQQHTSYLFFHVQDKDCCIETPTSQPLKLYLGFDFESVDVQARALAILKKHCRVDWNGDHGTRICVSPKVPPSVQWMGGGALLGAQAIDRGPLASASGSFVRRCWCRSQAGS